MTLWHACILLAYEGTQGRPFFMSPTFFISDLWQPQEMLCLIDKDWKCFNFLGLLTYAAGLLLIFWQFWGTMFENFQVKDAKAQLKTRGENVDKKTAESYDPTPSTLGVVVLTKGGRFAVTSQGWKKKYIRKFRPFFGADAPVFDKGALSLAPKDFQKICPTARGSW